MMESRCLAVLVLLYFSYSKSEWCSTEESCGPNTWTFLGSCNGSRQSPINIAEVSAQFSGNLGQFVFTNYSKKEALLTTSNTRHTVEISISDGVSISGGGLPSTYLATAFHFHRGNGTSGSEHRLSGRQYPMEMHIVHTKSGMNLSQAKQDPSGIAVLGFFIDVMDSANKSQLEGLSDLLVKVSIPGESLQLNSSFSLADLLGDVNLTTYYRYNGSLTTPTCDQAVLWTVFKYPITVPSKVVKTFSSAVKYNISGTLETMQNNFRPPQALDGRSVQASFPSVMPPSPSGTAASTIATSSQAALQPSMLLSILMLPLLLLTRL